MTIRGLGTFAAVCGLLLVVSVGGWAQTKENPLRPGNGVKPPKQTKMVIPEYPPEAKAKNVRGVVVLELLVSDEGRVDSIKVRKEVPHVTEAAVAAAKQWQFEPTVVDGKKAWIALTMTIPFPPRGAAK